MVHLDCRRILDRSCWSIEVSCRLVRSRTVHLHRQLSEAATYTDTSGAMGRCSLYASYHFAGDHLERPARLGFVRVPRCARHRSRFPQGWTIPRQSRWTDALDVPVDLRADGHGDVQSVAPWQPRRAHLVLSLFGDSNDLSLYDHTIVGRSRIAALANAWLADALSRTRRVSRERIRYANAAANLGNHVNRAAARSCVLGRRSRGNWLWSATVSRSFCKGRPNPGIA